MKIVSISEGNLPTVAEPRTSYLKDQGDSLKLEGRGIYKKNQYYSQRGGDSSLSCVNLQVPAYSRLITVGMALLIRSS